MMGNISTIIDPVVDNLQFHAAETQRRADAGLILAAAVRQLAYSGYARLAVERKLLRLVDEYLADAQLGQLPRCCDCGDHLAPVRRPGRAGVLVCRACDGKGEVA